jgi:hypothetical protein
MLFACCCLAAQTQTSSALIRQWRESLIVLFRGKFGTPKDIAVRSPAILALIANPPKFDPKQQQLEDEGEARRCKIILELLSTERNFVSSLSLMVNLYMLPIAERQLMTPEEVKSVFGEVQALLQSNTQLQQALEGRISEWEAPSTIGDLFQDVVRYCPIALPVSLVYLMCCWVIARLGQDLRCIPSVHCKLRPGDCSSEEDQEEVQQAGCLSRGAEESTRESQAGPGVPTDYARAAVWHL